MPQSSMPPEHALHLRYNRKKGLCLLVGLLVTIPGAFVLASGKFGDLVDRWQAGDSGYYSPKFTMLVCIFVLGAPLALIMRLIMGPNPSKTLTSARRVSHSRAPTSED